MRRVSIIVMYLIILFYIIQPLKANQEKEQPACQVRIVNINTEPGKAAITLQFNWKNKSEKINKKDMAVVFIFELKLFYKLSSEILAQDHKYTVNILPENMVCKMTELSYKEKNESKYGGALIVFYPSPECTIDLTESCEKNFIIPIQSGSLKTGAPTIMGAGTLCVSLFKKEDASINHLNSKNYKQLSNVASTYINLEM
ncbi:hypothetical protein HZA55_03600 [Candidatus Poribacteria bacterium]|nr:hypothetical protein [Candidatus Poribacteria bacterium]